MNRLQAALADIGEILDQWQFQWALVGGLAVSVRVEPRFTRDVDLAVAVKDDLQAEGLVHRLTQTGYRVLESVEQQTTERLATARLTPPDGDGNGVVDLLFASSGIEPEVVASTKVIEMLPSLKLRVAGR